MVLEDSRCGARWFAIDICLSAHIFLKPKRYVVLVGCQFWQEACGRASLIQTKNLYLVLRI